MLTGPFHAGAQLTNPVFVDDSPAAAEGLSRARAMADNGNLDEAARTLQKLLETEGDRLLPDASDSDHYGAVRDSVHAALQASPDLLSRYRLREEPVAAAMLSGELGGLNPLAAAYEVERTRLLTPAGLTAALRVAQRQFESAQFDAALFTLAELDPHPDRTLRNPETRTALTLLTTTLTYVDRPWAASLEAKWRTALGLSADSERKAASKPVIPRGLSSFDAGPEIDLSDIVAQPLRSNDIVSIAAANDAKRGGNRGVNRAAPGSSVVKSLHVFLVIAGDTIFVNDGLTIRAWDRFTLSEIWRWSPATVADNAQVPIRGRPASSIFVEDVATLAVYNDWVIAATGLSVQGVPGRIGDARVHALDSRTGEERWSVTLENLDPVLRQAHIRGPAIIDQGVVVFTARKEVRERRLLSAFLVGLDLATGKLRWVRLVASAGSLPYSQAKFTSDYNTLYHGVIYRSDRLGVVAAVETATGRPRWARRFKVEVNTRRSGRPWQSTGPIVLNGALIALSPDRDWIMALDPATGDWLGRRDSRDVGAPQYILGAAKRIVAVAQAGISVIDAADLLSQEINARPLLTLDEGAIAGRAIIAGGEVLAPVESGLIAAHIARGAGGPTRAKHIALDHSGNLLALQSQLIVAGDRQVHSYLIWQVAQRMLRERMEADPTNPAPAATYAELAFRAGKTDLIVNAVQAAMRAIESAPLADRSVLARQRLFRSILVMVEPDSGPTNTPILLGSKVRSQLLGELGRLASSSQERVAHLLALADFYVAERKPRRAAEAQQQILTDPQLAAVSVERRSGQAINARIEATRRLQRLVRDFGPDVYTLFAQESARTFRTLGPTSSPAQLEAFAWQYPAARSAVEALFLAARRRIDEHRVPTAIADLEAAFLIANVATSDPFDPLLAESGGQLVTTLLETGRPAAAISTLDRVERLRPGLSLSVSGETRAPADLRARATALAASLDRLPNVGPLTDAAYSLEGWRLSRPLTTSADAPTDRVLLEDDEHLALWTLKPNREPSRVWTLPIADRLLVLRMTADRVLLARQGSRGWTLESRLLRNAGLQWASSPFESLFDDPALQRNATVDLGGGDVRPADELLFAATEQAYILANRAGQVAAITIATGHPRWTARPLSIVTDIAAGVERIVLTGAPLQDADPARPQTTAIVALDPATGDTTRTFVAPLGTVRWVRLDQAENILTGMSRGVASIDPRNAAIRWSVRSEPSATPRDAWVLGGLLVTLSDDGKFRLRAVFDGGGPSTPLDTASPVQQQGLSRSPVVVRAIGDRVLISTMQGLALFASDGKVVGRNRSAVDAPFLPAVVARNRVFTAGLQSGEFRRNEPGRRYPLFNLDLHSAALLEKRSVILPSRPLDIAALDGGILIASRSGVVFISAPAPDSSRQAQ